MGFYAALLLLGLAMPADDSAAADAPDQPLRASLVFGYGSSVGGLGGSGEVYFAGSRVSLFGGLGYVPSSDGGRGASGPAFAVGARGFAGGRRHRGFLEGSFSPLMVEIAPEGSGAQGDDILYGPSVSLGYQFVGSSGVTFVISGGVGWTVTGPDYIQGRCFHSTVAVGYTWRVKRP